MRYFKLLSVLSCSLFLLLAGFLQSGACAQEHIKKRTDRFAPTQMLKFEWGGTIYTLPYVYYHDFGKRKISAEGINKRYYTDAPLVEFLWPSLAPVPQACSNDTTYCEAPPVPGYKAPPKGQKQTVIVADYLTYHTLDSDKSNRDNIFSPLSINRDKQDGLYYIDENLGVEVLTSRHISKLTHFKPIDSAYQHIFLHCYKYWCRMRAAVKEDGWTYYFYFHRAHLAEWRNIYRDRKGILQMSPPVLTKSPAQ